MGKQTQWADCLDAWDWEKVKSETTEHPLNDSVPQETTFLENVTKVTANPLDLTVGHA